MRRWWERYGLQVLLVGLALGTAWGIRQTQGAGVLEVYQVITRPFHLDPMKAEQLSDARMLELQARVAELESQNQKLQQLLGYAQPDQSHSITAPIVGRSADHWWQQITLGRGSQAGIQEGFTVTAPGGLVGRIVSVTPDTSRVLLISDHTSQVGVTISRSREMGFLRGQSTTHAVMQFFERVPNVRRGDIVSTSTYSQLFPAGLPVGRVESVNLTKSPAPEATIELSAPIRYLEWVVVHPKTRKYE